MKVQIIFALVLMSLSNPLQSQHAHDHEAHLREATQLREPGQGGYAALSEIVSHLMERSETKWDTVDIEGLRLHLLDMDNLFTHANVTIEELPNGLRIHASKNGLGGDAVTRMVPAHAPVLASETGWVSEAKTFSGEIIWTVSSPTDAQIIKALGFFGLMAIGDHHRSHHLNLAIGQTSH